MGNEKEEDEKEKRIEEQWGVTFPPIEEGPKPLSEEGPKEGDTVH